MMGRLALSGAEAGQRPLPPVPSGLPDELQQLLQALKDQLDKCLKGKGEKALLDRIKKTFRSRNESLEEDAAELEDRLRSCTRSSVPEEFDASIEFVYDCKVTGWRR